MKVFLDTSSLIKLYFIEDGTASLDSFFNDNVITEIYISEITKTEFFSAIYKKLRTKDISQQNANDILQSFVSDLPKYQIILLNSEILNQSQNLISKYGVKGLRSLDAIQLASVCSMALIDIAISGDKLLNSFLVTQGLKIFAAYSS